MAKTISQLNQAQERLKLKAQQLSLRVKMQEDRQKHSDLTRKLKTMGGRIR
jgi:ABC-type phosphate transport system auxiliary subunit